MPDQEIPPGGDAAPPPAPLAAGATEQTLLHRLVSDSLVERRRARRWGIFFKLLLFVYLFVLLAVFVVPGHWPFGGLPVGRHTALVDLKGIIAPGTAASADNVIRGLRAAFDAPDTAGVILRINSPGGSPVQAGEINTAIKRLRKAHPDIPLYAVITDLCASGGYYVAVAADQIYANQASLVGSIGVLMDGFGFVGTLKKLGIERRLITAGARKGFMDPFSPEKPADVAHVHEMLADIHRQFIKAVRQGRGSRLKPNPELFSGLVWTGDESLKLGLIDGIGDTHYVASKLIGAPRIVDYTRRRSLFERLTDRVGTTMANTVLTWLSTPQLR
ncbi:putative signal peptide peptidase SppA [bacterium BMS3Bbin12]|nr:putative signal peptide peptidase SppA [bacterium BMS3Abin12]GBE47659.1 putative signal peptide peptidase SppA [bacterium BMS3Bbin12]GBE51262.1 putative signal peptide peptidase SppA [bacterium BMS3Bbin13]HDJ86279.1 S49 family peptidase [Chromatiales bacterium]HDK03207.1 S49 family peptidase [Gammaproteobacteria bacterium]